MRADCLLSPFALSVLVLALHVVALSRGVAVVVEVEVFSSRSSSSLCPFLLSSHSLSVSLSRLHLPPQPISPLVRAGGVHAPKVDVVEADDLVFLSEKMTKAKIISVSRGQEEESTHHHHHRGQFFLFFFSVSALHNNNHTLNLSDFGLWRTNELAPTRPLSSGADEAAALALSAAAAAEASTTPILFLLF